MIKKIINLDVKITNNGGKLVKYSITVSGSARIDEMETIVKNALYKQHDLHSANIHSVQYDVRKNNMAELVGEKA